MSSDIAPHLDRMQKEIEELQDNISKLRKFLITPAYESLSFTQQQLLALQLNAMQAYLSILDLRLRNETTGL